MSPWPTIRELAAELADDRLDGASCTGRAALFDAEVDGEDDNDRAYRLDAAARICRGCPVQAECDAIARELGGQAIGVWAGLARGVPRPRGRPKAGAA
ncbi:WhiB family transcriptional regulator [Nocardia mangyaensis]|uniref:WhiB family transcriptional regulator n=1 Tax=Nocardia mangyaensis TaxID=2213200 RepID=UPI002676F638|nr:WhiB family transcriptional regulator [Nocardia mangyaensis]MDO3647679.1 WhiB family transcriptional regulator [Nocardia mangyaensis]